MNNVRVFDVLHGLFLGDVLGFVGVGRDVLLGLDFEDLNAKAEGIFV